jgi:phosphoribosylformylglycinamidine cyclo-ligase
MDYKQAGVDIEAGDRLVDWLKEQNQVLPNPHQDKIVSGIGGFASLFRFPKDKYESPCLVSCTDGVGTKLKLAIEFESYESVGQDLVAMCLNDLICCGADPLFFLDYYATGKLKLPAAQAFLKGVRQACVESDCALIGGETAEMPGMYSNNDFDCAGFAIGVVDEKDALGSHRVQDGDRVVGVSSSGFHSNGYSLLRKLFESDMDRWKDELLIPTALYVKLFQRLRGAVELHALAHITGGGIDNVRRVLPAGTKWTLKDWPWSTLVNEAQRRAGITREEMLKTFNCGLGLVAVLPEAQASGAMEIITQEGFQAYDLGRIGQ